MNYRKDIHGDELSILGYGCMRFSRKGAGVDIEKTERELMAAYRSGVNYFDTAYIYPGSEAALGEILERNGIRDKVRIATKLPQYLVRNKASPDKYFDEELSRLESHIRQMNQYLEAQGETGKKMDFLIQEMNREANTIGSKASDATIAQHVVDLKSEIEKLREQIQNVE